MMKKLLTVLTALGIVFASLTIVGTAAAQGQGPGGGFPGGRGRGGPGNQGYAQNEELHALVVEAYADAFGITVEELDAMLAEGQTMSQIAADYGYDFEAFRALMEEVMTSVHEAAVKAGILTEGQFPRFGQGPGFGGPGGRGGFGGGLLNPYMHNAIAEQLGLTPEELQAKVDAGQTMFDIATEMGFSADEIADLMETARESAVQAAVDAGDLTQEQADLMEQRGNRPGKCLGGFPGGRGGRFGQPAP